MSSFIRSDISFVSSDKDDVNIKPVISFHSIETIETKKQCKLLENLMLFTKKQYHTPEKTMIIKCKSSNNIFNYEYDITFDDGYTCQIRKLHNQNDSFDIDLDEVGKIIKFHYLFNRFVTRIIIHQDIQTCPLDVKLKPTYTLYVQYIPSKVTEIKVIHLKKEHKWIFIKNSSDYKTSYDELNETCIVDLKNELCHWFPEREYHGFSISYDMCICKSDEEMPETFTITARYID